MRLAVRHALFSPRMFIWSAALGALAAAVLVYLLDPWMQRFEGVFPGRELRDLLAPVAAVASLPPELRFWLADFAWSAVAALFVAEISGGTRIPGAIRALLVMLAATSWELLQAFGVIAGVFDPVDLGASALAGVTIWVAHRIFIAGKATREALS